MTKKVVSVFVRFRAPLQLLLSDAEISFAHQGLVGML
jgi:hypothetical protein